MSAISKIEWCDRTWNPVRGCSIVSPGCVNCYAMKQAHRFSGPARAYEGLTKQTKAGPQWTGQVRTVESALLDPLSWRKPQRVFVNSMSDLFHENVPDAFIDAVFAVMGLAQQHTFQVLTKRADRMLSYVKSRTDGDACTREVYQSAYRVTDDNNAGAQLEGETWPWANVWLGVSCEDQQRADERIPLLLQTPAAVRFVSAEPLIGPLSFRWAKWDNWSDATGERRPVVNEHDGLRMLDWVIVGGESGAGARPCELNWIQSIVKQCEQAVVPVFVKQLGSVPMMPEQEWRDCGDCVPLLNATNHRRVPKGYVPLKFDDRKGGDPIEWPEDLRVRQFPRSAGIGEAR